MTRVWEYVNRWQHRSTSHVLLYHSTFHTIPPELGDYVHNVSPEELGRQVEWLKKHFDLVTVDECVLNPQPGHVAITFDDAYDCVFAEAQPILESLEVPFTVFVNGASLSGVPFWRDLVRLIMNRGLTDRFLKYWNNEVDSESTITSENFYHATKSSRVSSRKLHEAMLEFLEEAGEKPRNVTFCLASFDKVRRSPFLHLGNHSLHHYVLSSLSDEEQDFEIRENSAILRKSGHPLAKTFSIPFGRPNDFNEHTLRCVLSDGYSGVVLSRNRLNCWSGNEAESRLESGLAKAERYMPEATYEQFHRQITRLWLRRRNS